MIFGVTGGRDHEPTRAELGQLRAYTEIFGHWLRGGEILSMRIGDCKTGVDARVLRWAMDRGLDFEVYCADPDLGRLPEAARDRAVICSNWRKQGRAAGPIRNARMVPGCDRLVAFPGGTGTANCREAAHEVHVPVWEIDLGRYTWRRGDPPQEGWYVAWTGLWQTKTRWDGREWRGTDFLSRRGFHGPLLTPICWREA